MTTSSVKEPSSSWTLHEFEDAIHRGNVALWSWHPDHRTVELDELALQFWGFDADEDMSVDDLIARIDPRDADIAKSSWQASASSADAYDFSFRIGRDDNVRWIAARGHGVASNRDDGTVLAVFVDITEQKEGEEFQQLLVHELSHRIGNLFAVASTTVSMASREAASVDELANDVALRFQALHKGFTSAGKSQLPNAKPTPLVSAVGEMLSPYCDQAECFRIDIPEAVVISSEAMTQFALILHELVTNSLKYGALKYADGHVKVDGSLKGTDVIIRWTEHGAADLSVLPKARGFGTSLMERTARTCFRGDIKRGVEKGRYTVTMTFDRDALTSR